MDMCSELRENITGKGYVLRVKKKTSQANDMCSKLRKKNISNAHHQVHIS
jgi:hypothetical protein